MRFPALRCGVRHFDFPVPAFSDVPLSGVPRRGLGGLEPLPLVYDLRNIRVRIRQNMIFSTTKTKTFLGRAHSPLPRPFLQWGEGTPSTMPHSLRRLRHLDPSHSKILRTPLAPLEEVKSRVDCFRVHRDQKRQAAVANASRKQQRFHLAGRRQYSLSADLYNGATSV